ncbi:MAG: aminomethyl-transferring glycine dehydrogenase subunit GcvPA [Gammaproteobacteria bacterium]|nr:MAG: aminomethyl-transferring glycine dehydrogenase subunit GcvPA [Gammaproteobacteria bacterium]
MPFIPHTEEDIQQMLAAIGADSINDLFDEIPQSLRSGAIDAVPEGLSEMEISRIMHERARQDGTSQNFIGAGAYEHHIPAAVWEVTTRGEFYSAYTPYQAEASQGTLQLLYEFQTMMASLMASDVSNASLYDGATALAEAVLMAVRANRKSKSRKILIAGTVNPVYRKVVNTITENQEIELIELPFDDTTGITLTDTLTQYDEQDITALVVSQPNFFGRLELVDELTDWSHNKDALVIGVVNPLAMSLLKPPGEWGEKGADIACGEGQPLGIPLSSGGPYYGFLTCKQAIVRQMPGRLVGRTVDLDNKPGFTLTLQAREQHIRRSKATSNICTNQGLMVTASTIHMTMLGAKGLSDVATQCHVNTRQLIEKLRDIQGVTVLFEGPCFHEVVLKIDADVSSILRTMSAHGIQGGYDLSSDYPSLENCLLVCVTETKTESDLDQYVSLLDRVVGLQSQASCPVPPKM